MKFYNLISVLDFPLPFLGELWTSKAFWPLTIPVVSDTESEPKDQEMKAVAPAEAKQSIESRMGNESTLQFKDEISQLEEKRLAQIMSRDVDDPLSCQKTVHLEYRGLMDYSHLLEDPDKDI